MASSEDVVENCIKVLNKNRHGDYTVPSHELYPHQWLWDSCFTAIGLRHTDVNRAKRELLNLKLGAWSNGMLPNIIFNPGYMNFDHLLWENQKFPESPGGTETTGITQPPMLAEAVVKVGEKLPNQERSDWYKSMLSTLIDYHNWLYAERDPGKDGLVVLLHPYESGLDNSPPWQYLLKRMRYPWWVHALNSHSIQVIASHFRRDTAHIPESQRMGLKEALECFYAIRQLKKRGYKLDPTLPNSQVTMQDLAYNSILVRANKHLVNIAEQVNQPLPETLSRNMSKTENSLEKFWNVERSEYFSINYRSGKQIKLSTIATLMPLYAGSISKKRAELLIQKLKDSDLFNPTYPVPSVPINSRQFDPHKYWQGPTWLNTNWLIIEGLKNYGYHEEAEQLSQKSIELVAKSGASEYFSPLDGAGKGAKDFSWTASLAIDLIKQR